MGFILTIGFVYGSGLGIVPVVIFCVISNLLEKKGIILRKPIAKSLLFFFIISFPIFGYFSSNLSGESGLVLAPSLPFAFLGFMFSGYLAGNYVKSKKINKKSGKFWECPRCETVNSLKNTICYKCKYSKDFQPI